MQGVGPRAGVGAGKHVGPHVDGHPQDLAFQGAPGDARPLSAGQGGPTTCIDVDTRGRSQRVHNIHQRGAQAGEPHFPCLKRRIRVQIPGLKKGGKGNASGEAYGRVEHFWVHARSRQQREPHPQPFESPLFEHVTCQGAGQHILWQVFPPVGLGISGQRACLGETPESLLIFL